MSPARRAGLAGALAAFALALACAGPSAAALAVGQEAPAFRLPSLDGKQVALGDFRGKTVVLEWINPNCPISRRHADAKTMQTTATRHPEVVWLAINSTRRDHPDFVPAEEHARYLAARGITYPVLYDSDGAVGRAYGAKTTPHMFVVDPQGKVVYMGAIDDDPRGAGAKVNYVDSALAALAAGGSPEPAATKPYGCSVKY
jgi:peroxiredoxin